MHPYDTLDRQWRAALGHAGQTNASDANARQTRIRRRLRTSTLATCVVVGGFLVSAVGASAQVFQVVGTCADGICGLNIRNGPGFSNYAKIGGLYDGNAVNVICQTRGQLVTPGKTAATRVWDQIVPAGSYVTDAYISTPGRASGTFSLPRCPPTASIGSPGNGGAYNQGQVVGTSFSCSEALGEGDNIQSCADTHGGAGSSGTLDTSTAGAHTYTVTATSTDGATGSASISYSVRGTPQAKINTPAEGGHFLLGSSVPTHFECIEGAGGPGIQSCTDSNGASGGAGTLDTGTAGPHTYTVTANSADGASGVASIGYTVAAAKVSCTGNAGRISYTPGVTGVATVQIAKVRGTLSGCAGGSFTSAKYSATVKTTAAVSCETLAIAPGAQATGPLIVKWSPKAKGVPAESTGTLTLAATEAAGVPLSGLLESGQFTPSDIAGAISQTFAKAANCGLSIKAKPVKPLKAATFTGSLISLY